MKALAGMRRLKFWAVINALRAKVILSLLFLANNKLPLSSFYSTIYLVQKYAGINSCGI